MNGLCGQYEGPEREEMQRLRAEVEVLKREVDNALEAMRFRHEDALRYRRERDALTAEVARLRLALAPEPEARCPECGMTPHFADADCMGMGPSTGDDASVVMLRRQLQAAQNLADACPAFGGGVYPSKFGGYGWEIEVRRIETRTAPAGGTGGRT